MQYNNARYYNPSTGRFLTQDTYTGNLYSPWTQHLYAYCGNNPTSMIDPTGHSYQETGYGLVWVDDGKGKENHGIGGNNYGEWWDDLIPVNDGSDPLTLISTQPPLQGMTDACHQNFQEFQQDPSVSSFIKWMTIGSVDGKAMANGNVVAWLNAVLYSGSFFVGGEGASSGLSKTEGLSAESIARATDVNISDTIVVGATNPKSLVIGENMDRVVDAANNLGAGYYQGMPGYQMISNTYGESFAQSLGLANNEKVIQYAMDNGWTIYDIGPVGNSIVKPNYALESQTTASYSNLIKLW